MSGLFREVYILNRPQKHLRDYKITTDILDNVGIIDLSLDLCSEVFLYYGDNLLQKKSGDSVHFEIFL